MFNCRHNQAFGKWFDSHWATVTHLYGHCADEPFPILASSTEMKNCSLELSSLLGCRIWWHFAWIRFTQCSHLWQCQAAKQRPCRLQSHSAKC